MFFRSPFSAVCLILRRLRLYYKGVRFGSGLSFEGSVEVTAPEKVRLGNCVKLGKHIYLGAWPEGKLFIGNNSYIGRLSIIQLVKELFYRICQASLIYFYRAICW